MSGTSLLMGAGVLTGSALATQMIGFLYRVLLSRAVGAEAMGVYHLVLSAYSVMLAVCLSGLCAASLRLSANLKAVGRPEDSRALVRRLLVIFFLLAGACALVTVSLKDIIADNLLKEPRTGQAILCLLPVMALTGVENILKNHFTAIGRVLPTALCEIGEMCLRSVAVFAMLIVLQPENAGDCVAVIILGMAVSEVFSACTLWTLFRRSGRTAKQSTVSGRQIAAIALPVSATNLGANLLSSANSVLIPARLALIGVGRGEALSLLGTIFGMTMPLVTFPMVMLDGLFSVIVPQISGDMALGDLEAVRRKAAKAFLAVSAYAVPAAAVMVKLGSTVAEALYGTAQAGQYVAPLCIVMILGALRGISSCIMSALGQHIRGAVYFIGGSVIQLLCTWYGCANLRIGIYGAIWGMGLSAAVTLCCNLGRIVRKTGLKVQFVSWFVCPAAAASAALVVADRLERLLPEGIGAQITAAVGLGAIYLLLMKAMGIDHRQLIRFSKRTKVTTVFHGFRSAR